MTPAVARPSLVCPRCGSADTLGVVVGVDDRVVRRCLGCEHRFTVGPSDVDETAVRAWLRAETIAEVEAYAADNLGRVDNRAAFAVGMLHVYIERAVEQLHLAGCTVEALELDEAERAAHRIAFGRYLHDDEVVPA